jgi:hypothetical protein
MSGWIKLHRSIQNNWLFTEKRKFSKLEAWIDIILTCNHSDNKVMIKGKLYDVKRGQSILSLDSWSKRWDWDKSSVRRFFGTLQKEAMIVYTSDNITTHLTVCKYEDYQGTCNTDETPTKRGRTSNDTNPRMKEEKEEEKPKKIFFKYSSIFDIVKFKEEFKDWNDEKVKYYHDALNTWSNEGNKKIDWVATARTWASRDEKTGKIKFDVKKPTLTINNQFALMR